MIGMRIIEYILYSSMFEFSNRMISLEHIITLIRFLNINHLILVSMCRQCFYFKLFYVFSMCFRIEYRLLLHNVLHLFESMPYF